MTQLDRLEALADKWMTKGIDAGPGFSELSTVAFALPDLVRVAREYARHKLLCPAGRSAFEIVHGWRAGSCDCGFAECLLYREVES